jgi:tetratricopeptide (TPR) repeat protein
VNQLNTGTTLERARLAAAAGEWQVAADLFREADDAQEVGLADLPMLADIAYAAGHLDVTIQAWERAYAGFNAAGQTAEAAGAAVRVALHMLFDTALMAPVRGWLSRAEALLEPAGTTPADAWFAVVRTYERILTADRASAGLWARRAIEVGDVAAPAAAAIGRVAEARLLILDGEIAPGLALLEQAGLAATSGDLDPLSTGVVYCELVCALQGLAQYDLAEQWTEAMERWSAGNAIGSVHGRCRVHRAEILRLRGECHQAQAEALGACEELRPYLRRELGWPLNELGRIRLRLGDVAGAEEALLAAHRAGWDAQPGLALVLLAQGDVPAAVTSIRDALETPQWVPSKELPPATDLRRAPLLHAEVEIALAAGDIEQARAAAEEVQAIATRFGSQALTASAADCGARVRLAAGDAEQAELLFTEAARLWRDVGAPYEEAVARLGLAAACRAQGGTQRGLLEQRAAESIIDQIRSVSPTEPAAVPASQRGSIAAASGGNSFHHDGDYWRITFEGSTVHVRDRTGLHHLARLLAEPGREFHVLDLAAVAAGNPSRSAPDGQGGQPGFGHTGAMLDEQAKAAYRRRLSEIDDDIQESRAGHDLAREQQAEAEREFLLHELARAIGLGGRDRRANSASERARASVTLAIRRAIAAIDDHNSHLGRHLQQTIRTGTYCAYQPDVRISDRWQL